MIDSERNELPALSLDLDLLISGVIFLHTVLTYSQHILNMLYGLH